MKKYPMNTLPVLAGMFAVLLSILACGSSAPTPVPSNTVAPPPPKPTNTRRPTPTEDLPPAYFTEEFSVVPENWYYDVLFGDESYFSQSIEDDMLVMQLDDVDLYAYNFYDPYVYEDVIIEVFVTNMGRNSNNVNIICRYSDYGWYEFTVQNDGLYSIWAYDEAGGTEYQMLWSGASAAIQTGKASNVIDVLCKSTPDGNLLSIMVNSQELKTITDKRFYMPAGLVGFGVNVSPSNPVVPVIVGFDYVTIAEP